MAGSAQRSRSGRQDWRGGSPGSAAESLGFIVDVVQPRWRVIGTEAAQHDFSSQSALFRVDTGQQA